ncbi:hypothetical protein OPQ81_008025 [Rhizoctonia solani]|nr:hypothetical protein OPQ81_008025 [Rhizoctonia solani]
MFKFSSVKGDRSSGSNYLRQLQREIKTKVKGPTRTDNGGGSAAWNALEKALRALHARAQLIPPLRSAIDGLISILGVFEATARAHKEYEQLASNLVATIEMLEQHLKSSNSTKVNDKILEISSLIEEQVLSIHNRQGFNRISAALEDEFTVLSYRQIEMLFCHIQASTIVQIVPSEQGV